ncbi:MAG: formyltransferase family protein [Candidatus Paceibacterota bacterium]|jgi:phosphoribosylglycinamide formyltransferase-1
MTKPKLVIFASGSKDGGGSGFEKLVENMKAGILLADIVAVVSNHEQGGVRERADRLGIPFIHSPKPRTAEDYKKIVRDTKADFVALSGWLGIVEGLDPKTTFNIHPAWLPSPFGGHGFYGHHVHEAVIEAYKNGEAAHSGVSMHFVTPAYDEGAVFFRKKVEILPGDTAETLAKRVNKVEHEWQSIITNKVIHGEISWDGENPSSLSGAVLD